MTEQDATARALDLMNLTAESMWQKIRALEKENARLREALTVIRDETADPESPSYETARKALENPND